MIISFSRTFPKVSFIVLSLTSIILCFGSLPLQLYTLVLGPEHPLSITPFFDLTDGLGILDPNGESSIPAWFSSSLLLLCSVLLLGITLAIERVAERSVLYWGALTILFVLLSLDEAVWIHERLTEPIRFLLSTSGLLYYAWVIPGWALVIVIVLAYRKFVLSLPARIRLLIIAAGAVYILGGLGLEMLGGLEEDYYGTRNFTYLVLVATEEFLEMIGAVLFLYALMEYTRHLKNGSVSQQNKNYNI